MLNKTRGLLIRLVSFDIKAVSETHIYLVKIFFNRQLKLFSIQEIKGQGQRED